MSQPRYEIIKNHLLDQIELGELQPGTRVASENQLSKQFSVSRMTARRALDELSDEGILFRSQGLGTFVADSRPMSSMLEIQNIADEIRQRGHECTIKVVSVGPVVATESQASWLGLPSPATVFNSVLVFYENGQAIQLEDRLVNPKLVPEYLDQDFTKMTPNEYLTRVAPLTEADHIVEAMLASDVTKYPVAEHLEMPALTACLRVLRRTYSSKGVVSVATLIHPGDRYRLGGHIHFNQQG
jgi:GntR family histidine utilization transcriptional repressor